MNFNPSSSAPQPPSSGFKNIKPLTRKERRALKDKVAELRERNGKLEGKVEVFERLFSIVEARPKQ